MCLLQLVTSTASGSEESVSTAVFLAIMKGTERLLLADVLSRTDTEAVIKLSMDRSVSPAAGPVLCLLWSCLVSGVGQGWTFTFWAILVTYGSVGLAVLVHLAICPFLFLYLFFFCVHMCVVLLLTHQIRYTGCRTACSWTYLN